MITRLQKWGNSLSIRIPKPFAAQLGLEENMALEISIESGRLIVTPSPAVKYSLDELLSNITAENLHSEIPTGDAVGKETW